MGRFLKNEDGTMVIVGGAPVLEKILDRKPRDCQGCGFCKWIRGDRLFILQRSTAGSMIWLCPDCALDRGLPRKHYRRNYYSTRNLHLTKQELAERRTQRAVSGGLDLAACMCGF